MSEHIETDYINQIRYVPKEQNNNLVDFSHIMEECVETSDDVNEEKVITKIPHESFLHNLITELHKHPTPYERLKQKCPDWWFNIDSESILKYIDELDNKYKLIQSYECKMPWNLIEEIKIFTPLKNSV